METLAVVGAQLDPRRQSATTSVPSEAEIVSTVGRALAERFGLCLPAMRGQLHQGLEEGLGKEYFDCELKFAIRIIRNERSIDREEKEGQGGRF
jgi:hypothetical protein